MVKRLKAEDAERQIHELAEFRFALRKFLHFSEEAATRVGLTPQQHQLLLQIAGAPKGAVTAVGYLAERLALRHHSVVELGNRCEDAGLIVRASDPENRRHVVLKMTAEGNRLLRKLSADHARELNELGPGLLRALTRIRRPDRQGSRADASGNEVNGGGHAV
jgi:DNA-binding MarR family transcriptional regulator